MSDFVRHLDWIHFALVAIAILGPLVVKAFKDRNHAQISAVLEAVIRGVEDHYQLSGDDTVKTIIKERAVVEGVEGVLNPIVKRVAPSEPALH